MIACAEWECQLSNTFMTYYICFTCMHQYYNVPLVSSAEDSPTRPSNDSIQQAARKIDSDSSASLTARDAAATDSSINRDRRCELWNTAPKMIRLEPPENNLKHFPKRDKPHTIRSHIGKSNQQTHDWCLELRRPSLNTLFKRSAHKREHIENRGLLSQMHIPAVGPRSGSVKLVDLSAYIISLL